MPIRWRKTVNVVGVDVSASTGVVVLAAESGSVVYKRELSFSANGKPSTRLARAAALMAAVTKLLMDHPSKLVVIEGYGYNNRFSGIMLAELGCAARLACYRVRVPFVEVAPTVLKKMICGAGNAKKDMMRLHAFKRWGFEDASDNVVDAYCLAQVGLLVEKGKGFDAYTRGVVKNLRLQLIDEKEAHDE